MKSKTESLYGALYHDFDYPASREALILMDLYDRILMSNVDEKSFKRSMLYPRPFKVSDPSENKLKGDVISWSDADKLLSFNLTSEGKYNTEDIEVKNEEFLKRVKESQMMKEENNG